ncbi:MAG: FAD-binding protein [Clostridiales bacterium]|nr:FAD-binding protein [Clostridiales bacterium]
MRSSASSSAETFSTEKRPAALTGNLTAARIVVAGGRGLGSRENFLAMVDLAELLGAQAAGTRGALDARWIPHEREIGLSGVRVAPELYLACGLSGANFHTIGMEHSRFIIAVNPDPSARIHELANLSVYEDANRCVRELTEYAARRRAECPELDPAALVRAYFQPDT